MEPELRKEADLYEHPWDRQCVLSLDGGGIRGYSSLIILRRLMTKVKELETKDLEGDNRHAHSSFHPGKYIPCTNNIRNYAQSTRENGSTETQGEGSDAGSTTCGECCRYLPCHYFDYIGGTSTGGLISIMLGRLRMSVDECIKEYKKLSSDIFGHPRLASVRGPIPWLRDKYDGKTIQRAVEDVVERRMSKEERQSGAGNFNSPLGLCRTVVFAYAQKISKETSEYVSSSNRDGVDAELPNSAPYLFRSYDHWGAVPAVITDRNPGIAHSNPIWEVARATTAAPFYFDPVKISNRKFGDGGFGTNNPALEMFFEVASMNGNDIGCFNLLLSIGTGESSISRLESGPLAKYLGYFRAARKLASDSTQVHLQMESLKENSEIPYHRFDVPERFELGRMKLDELKMPTRRREGTLAKIERVTDEYCDTIAEELNEVAVILVNHRKERMESDWWDLVSTGLRYRCRMRRCRRCQELRPRRKDLELHLSKDHSLDGDALKDMLTKGICPPVQMEEQQQG
ncbi:hypothetical protein EG329_006211 [Mollisiaceae sp. DMI_Dod_QoI]|nr:hypothetical protein EG329_006211 [Helotiales sp. DMI_Dod_QoI]